MTNACHWIARPGMMIALLGGAQLAFAQHVPTVRQWLSLRSVGAPAVSPDDA